MREQVGQSRWLLPLAGILVGLTVVRFTGSIYAGVAAAALLYFVLMLIVAAPLVAICLLFSTTTAGFLVAANQAGNRGTVGAGIGFGVGVLLLILLDRIRRAARGALKRSEGATPGTLQPDQALPPTGARAKASVEEVFGMVFDGDSIRRFMESGNPVVRSLATQLLKATMINELRRLGFEPQPLPGAVEEEKDGMFGGVRKVGPWLFETFASVLGR